MSFSIYSPFPCLTLSVKDSFYNDNLFFLFKWQWYLVSIISFSSCILWHWAASQCFLISYVIAKMIHSLNEVWVFIFRKSWHQIIHCFLRLWATSLGHKDIVWAFVYIFTGTKSDDGDWSNERCKHLKSCSNGADPHACTNLSSEWRPKVSGFSAFSFLSSININCYFQNARFK